MNEAQFLQTQLAATRSNFSTSLEGEAQAGETELKSLASAPPSSAIGRQLPGIAPRLQRWYLARGLLRLWEGDAAGWQDLRDFSFSKYWDGRVLETAYQSSTDPNRFRPDLGSTAFSDALLALHLGDVDRAKFTMQRLVAQSREVNAHNWHVLTGALAFQARLFERLTGEAVDLAWDELPPLGRYEPLLDDGLSGSAYSAALDWACQEHLKESQTRKGGVSVFTAGPYAPLPIELMSWRRYRRDRGLPHGTEGHALLESPLAALELPPPASQPTAFRRLIEGCLPHYRAYLAA